MAESVCTGDCLDVDANGRLIVVPDDRTIVCESDGSGGTHLVAKTIDCEPWPYSCGTTTGGSQVFCSGDDLFVRKPYYKMDRIGFDNLDPTLITKLRSPIGTTIREAFFTLRNEDPCCRTLCAKVWLDWNKHSIALSAGGAYEFDYQYTINGGATWITVSDSFHKNNESVMILHNPGGNTTHTLQLDLDCGETINLGMRIVTGEFHDPTTDFSGTSGASVYSFFADWIISSECD